MTASENLSTGFMCAALVMAAFYNLLYFVIVGPWTAKTRSAS